MLYDGDCGLCKAITAALLGWDRRHALLVTPIQSPAGDRLLADLPRQARLASLHVVDRHGVRRSGGAALAPLLAGLPGGGPIARLLRAAPGPANRAYELVAANRVRISRLVPAALKRRADSRLERALADSRGELARSGAG